MSTHTTSRGIIIAVIIILIILAGVLIVRRLSTPQPPPRHERGDVSASIPSSATAETDTIETTNGTKHSIPLNEILSGGPGKDGIPSIDNPRFESTNKADEWLDPDDPGLGVDVNNTARFYPYRILVWHEIVNDEIDGTPILVTYCPLCLTGIVFNPVVNDVALEFGVSGKLWKSNLLMYNRAQKEENESYWSQVLGEAVVGPHTGTKLAIIESDTMTYQNWKNVHPDTEVLSRETGAVRNYSRDPYEGYYESDEVSFGATFSDNRLHPKTVVLGVDIDGTFKAYLEDDLSTGSVTDTINDTTITINKDTSGRVRMENANGDRVSYVRGFWFSWLAAHPETLLWQGN